MRGVHCFFSGGRDSAVACYIAHRYARVKGLEFRLVFIDTTIAIPDVYGYVKRYAEWLGAELEVLRPRESFEELVKKYPYWPALYHNRWCKHYLKLLPAIEYYKRHPGDLFVLGIRRDESKFREKGFAKVFQTYCYKRFNVCVNLWFPLLRACDRTVNALLHRFGIPESPVWRIGISGECLCLAGTTRRTLDAIIHAYPDVARRLAELDEEMHRHRRSAEPSYPPPLIDRRVRLSEYVRQALSQRNLDVYLEYGGCTGSCLL